MKRWLSRRLRSSGRPKERHFPQPITYWVYASGKSDGSLEERGIIGPPDGRAREY